MSSIKRIGSFLIEMAFNALLMRPDKMDEILQIKIPPVLQGETLATIKIWSGGKVWRLWNATMPPTTDEMTMEEFVKQATPPIVITFTDESKPSSCSVVKPGQTGRYLGRYMGKDYPEFQRTLYVIRVYNASEWGTTVLVTADEFEFY